MTAPHHIQTDFHLIAYDPATGEVVSRSESVPALPQGGAAGALRISEYFSASTLDDVHRALQTEYAAVVPLRDADEPYEWGNAQLIPLKVGKLILVEIEKRDRPAMMSTALLQSRQFELTENLWRGDSLQAAMRTCCKQFTEVLGFDRSLVYQLEREGGPGQIIAESRNDDLLPSLLNLRFRDHDIPAEGYRKYGKQTVLCFTDSEKENLVYVDPAYPKLAEAIEYRISGRMLHKTGLTFLREHGISSQLSVVLRLAGKIWGMVFAHSLRPNPLDQQHTNFARLCGRELEHAIHTYGGGGSRRAHRAVAHLRTRIRQSIASAEDFFRGLTFAEPPLLEYLTATTGLGIRIDTRVHLTGQTPGKDEFVALLEWVSEHGKGDELFVSTRLTRDYPPAEAYADNIAGALCLPLNQGRTDWIVWFRQQHTRPTEYGSRGRGAVKTGKRFVRTIESDEGMSLPWTSEQITSVKDLQLFIRDIVVERYGEIARINQELKAAYEELEAFSYTVSHDLRAPLRGIDGFAEILMEEYGNTLDPEVTQLVRTIQDNAAKLNQFINDILDLSRTGRINLFIDEYDPTPIIQEAVREIEEASGAQLPVTIDSDLPKIRGDYHQLVVVFKQLLSNAHKYSVPHATPEIQVGFQPQEHEGYGEYFVTDNGIGIAAEHQHRIFGMFNRLVTEKEFTGSGVGLAIVDRIIKRHHGRIRIESETGRGATFFFHTNIPLTIHGQTSKPKHG